ncbi:MAG: hypothetical protein ACTMHW_02285, partial [Hafnia alvei]
QFLLLFELARHIFLQLCVSTLGIAQKVKWKLPHDTPETMMTVTVNMRVEMYPAVNFGALHPFR